MSNSQAPYALRREQWDGALLSVGQPCSEQTCSLVDFLPFKCQHCSEKFCGDHYAPTAHKCPKYDASKYDRVAPNCPLCNSPVAVPPGQDPNIRMERHISQECTVTTGKSTKTSSVPLCARGKCGKKLFAPIQCDKCRKQFCSEHRYPASHACGSLTTTSQPSKGLSDVSKLLSDLPTQASAKSNAAMAAVRRQVTAAAADKPTASGSKPIAKSSSSSSASASKTYNPLSKTDRRAKAERDSQRKAIAERARKGLLSEEEKVRWATMQAEMKEEGDKSECIIM